MKILIDENLSAYLEMLTYQVQCHKDLISFMEEKKMDENIINKYYEKYADYYTELAIAKNNLEHSLKSQINEPILHWSLDFYTHEVTIND